MIFENVIRRMNLFRRLDQIRKVIMSAPRLIMWIKVMKEFRRG